MILSAAACSNSSAGSESQPANTTSADSPETSESVSTELPGSPETSDTKILVVYFSRTGEQYTVGYIEKGNTEIVAEMIAEQTRADLFEILPEDDHYPMTYKELTEVAKKEQNEKARPMYAGELPDLSLYDTVFIGSPVWWGDWPMIMYTFFEENADVLVGKNLVPFSTNEGSGLAGFDRSLSSSCPESIIRKGLAVRGNDCQNDRESVRKSVDQWITELGY